MNNFKYLILLLCCILASSICFATPEYFQYDQRAFDEVVLLLIFIEPEIYRSKEENRLLHPNFFLSIGCIIQ
jgi:hypothetical protein